MIPLKFKDDVCPEFYKEFISNFEKRIKNILIKILQNRRKKRLVEKRKLF